MYKTNDYPRIIKSDFRNPIQILNILDENGFDIEYSPFPVGDYTWKNVCIEGKEINDFIKSVARRKGQPGTGRIWRQLEEMQQYKTKVLLVYHTLDELNECNRIPHYEKIIFTSIGRITQDYDVNVIWCPSYKMAAYYIMGLYRATYKEPSIKADVVKLKDPYVSFFYNIPNARVSPRLAKNIIEFIKDNGMSILDYLNSNSKVFESVKGFGKTRAEKIYEVLNDRNKQ